MYVGLPTRRWLQFILLAFAVVTGLSWPDSASSSEAREGHSHLGRAKIFLAAGDFHRAVEACQQEVRDRPSVESYVYLTYVYQAIDAYLDYLAKHDRWVAVEHLYLNLATGRVEDLVDPPDVLARIAKEMIQGAVRRQFDVTAAMAARLDQGVTLNLWKQQAAWRQNRPDDWWFGVPPGWNW